MESSIRLHRVGTLAVENRVSRLTIVIWLVLWIGFGLATFFIAGEFHGFAWGLICGGIISWLLSWLVFSKINGSMKNVLTATWKNSVLEILDSKGDIVSRLRLDKPHLAVLIQAKRERRLFLRLKEIEEEGKDNGFFSVFGPLPMVMPMKAMGDTPTLIGLDAKASSGSNKYQVDESNDDADAAMTALLEFVSKNRDRRVKRYDFAIEGGVVSLDISGFKKNIGGEQIDFPFEDNCDVLCKATEYESNNAKVAKVWIGLTEKGKKGKLVFVTIAPVEWMAQLPTDWDISKTEEDQGLKLYDDSPEAIVAATKLRYYIERVDPSNQILEILRH